MEDFHHDGKSLQFFSVTGEVLDQSKRSETRTSMQTQVSVRPGVPVITPHGVFGQPGEVTATTTASTHTQHFHEIWLRTDDGGEEPVEIGRGDIPLRTGQRVTIVGVKRGRRGLGGFIVNHTARAHWFISKGIGIAWFLKLERITGLSIAGAIALLWAIVYFTAPMPQYTDVKQYGNAAWGLAFGAAFAFFVYRVVRKVLRFRLAAKRVDAHMETLAQECHARNGGY